MQIVEITAKLLYGEEGFMCRCCHKPTEVWWGGSLEGSCRLCEPCFMRFLAWVLDKDPFYDRPDVEAAGEWIEQRGQDSCRCLEQPIKEHVAGVSDTWIRAYVQSPPPSRAKR